MDAIRVPVTLQASSHATCKRRRATAWFLAASVLLPAGIQAAAQEPVPAVWAERKLSFSYSSPTTIYSCRSMAGRVSSILRAVGARDDIQVRVSGCSDSLMTTQDPRLDTRVTTNPWQSASNRYREPGTTERRQVAQVYVRMMLPTEVTPEVLAELERDKTRRELVSRVTGNPAAKFNDPVLFKAERQLVTLSRDTIGIEPEECDLLDEMSVGVLREVGVRVVSTDFVCSANSLIPPEAVVEALLPTPYPTGSVQPAPGAAEEDQEEAGAPPAAEQETVEPPSGNQ
ncbi:MAG: hypothetical protein K0R70_2636 [Steroidobacteraceae bacterium]|nr:hypothetical protein [Steroidobacteraceae bacterium]